MVEKLHEWLAVDSNLKELQGHCSKLASKHYNKRIFPLATPSFFTVTTSLYVDITIKKLLFHNEKNKFAHLASPRFRCALYGGKHPSVCANPMPQDRLRALVMKSLPGYDKLFPFDCMPTQILARHRYVYDTAFLECVWRFLKAANLPNMPQLPLPEAVAEVPGDTEIAGAASLPAATEVTVAVPGKEKAAIAVPVEPPKKKKKGSAVG